MEVLLATSCVGLILGVIGFILNDIMPDDEYFEENERR